MLIVNSDSRVGIPRATLALLPAEALELIEKLSYLVRNPAYHHDHLEDYGHAVVDLLIITPDNIKVLHHDLRPIIEQYMHDQGEK